MVDRTGAQFPIVKDGDICRSVVLNSVPLYTADRLEEMRKANVDYMRLIFTDEDKKRCREICNAYINGGEISHIEFTRLQLFKGALL